MFRKEALEYRKWNGTAALFSVVPSWIILFLSLLIVFLIVLYLIFGSYTRREIMFGEVVMQPHPVILFSSKAGYVSECYIKINQPIKKGEPLFKIALERITHSGNVEANSINAINIQINKLKNLIQILNENYLDTLSNLNKQIENNRRIYSDTEKFFLEVSKSTDEYLLILNKYERLMKKGYSSNDEVEVQRSRYFEQKSLLNSLKEKLVQQEIYIINLENEIEKRKAEFHSQLVNYEMQKNELEIRLLEFESISELIISAPIDGFVESINVTVGQVIQEGNVIAQIVPSNKDKYQLVMWASNNIISFIKPNDKINIRYDAFPFEKFGQFEGIIRNISTVPASAQELAFYKNIPLTNPNTPLYKVIVSIPKQKVEYNNMSLSFLSGMKAEATVFLDNRKLYEWMFLPFYNATKNMEK